MQRLLILLAVCASAPPRAQEAAPGVKPFLGLRSNLRGTVGTGGYRGRSASASIGEEWRARAGSSDFTYDGSTDTVRTVSGRLSFQGENLAAGVSGSVTPPANSYQSNSVGADLGWTFLFEDAGVEEADMSVFWSRTHHKQAVPDHPTRGAQPKLVTDQDDYGAAASVTAFSMTLSADGYFSEYDRDVQRAARLVANRPALAGIGSLLDSFPANGQSVRWELEAWPAVIPFVSWQRVEFATGSPLSHTGGVGFTARVGASRLEVSYERVRQKGTPSSGYASFGGSLRF
jgi:hypothetical protein